MELCAEIISGFETLSALEASVFQNLVETTFSILLRHSDESALEGGSRERNKHVSLHDND